MPPLSSSTPVRRSSPRLATAANGSSETVVCSSSVRRSYGSRRSLKRTSADDSVVQTDSDRNRSSSTGCDVIQAEHRRQLRNSVVRNAKSSRYMKDITKDKPRVRNMFSSRRSSIDDDKLTDCDELAAKKPARRCRKVGWPKGVPRKKQVMHFCSR